MATVCKICGHVRNDYHNIYGTRCPGCGQLIRPETKPKFIETREQEKKHLQNKVLEKMRST